MSYDEIIDPVEFGVFISSLRHTDPLFVAVRLGVEVVLGRDAHARKMAQASRAISAAADWRAIANNHVTHAELQRRRAA